MYDISLERFYEAAKAIAHNALKTPLVPLDSFYLDSAVQDDKAMQDFESESLLMGVEHSQKVKATPIKSDYGSKDCVALASSTAESRLYLKAESLQPAGSFKIRGATFCIGNLHSEAKKRGVIAYSTGNHAQAVAYVAKQMNIPATIVMSPEAPAFKVARTKEYGAEVIVAPAGSEARMKLTYELARERNMTLIPSYDNLDIITGQGTIGLEILEELEPEVVFVPVGGGGLISGIAMAIKKQKPHVKIIGVEPELENDGYQSFQKGHKVKMEHVSSSICDAIKIQELGTICYPLMQQYVDEMVQVSEEEIIQALTLSLDRAHLFVEPSGALALAAARRYHPKTTKPIVCIASGGNTLLKNLAKIHQL